MTPEPPAATPRAVWLLTAVHVLLLVAYTALVPVYQAPDEPQHVDLVRAVAAERAWPVHGERHLSTQVTASLEPAAFHRVIPAPLPEGEAVPRMARPSFSELSADRPSQIVNGVTQHPPLYYAVAAVALTVLDVSEWPFDRVVAALRGMSVLLMAPLPLLAYYGCHRLRPDARTATAAAAVPLAIPQLTHIGASVTNDALLVVLMGVLTVLWVRAATGDTSRRTALWTGGVGALALLTKGFALVALPCIVAAYALSALRGRAAWRAAAARGALALALAVVGGGWWWGRNLAVGRLFPLGESYPSVPAGVAAGFAGWAGMWRDTMVLSYWGLFGWLDVPLRPLLSYAATLAVGAGIVAAFVLRRRSDAWWRADLALLLAPTLCLATAMAYRSWQDYQELARLVGVQGRYLFGGVVGVSVVVALGYRAALGSRWLPAGVLTVAAGLQAAAITTLLSEYWAGDVGALLAWSPWPVAVLIAVAVVLVAAIVALTASRWSSRSRRRRSAGSRGWAADQAG